MQEPGAPRMPTARAMAAATRDVRGLIRQRGGSLLGHVAVISLPHRPVQDKPVPRPAAVLGSWGKLGTVDALLINGS